MCQTDRILNSKGMTYETTIYIDEALELIKQGARIDGKNGVLFY